MLFRSVSMPLDFNDSLALQESMKGCDAVVHIAAHLKMWGPWADFVANNVTLTEQVIRAAQALGVRRFVHVSAASVVMHAPGPIHHADESSPLTQEQCLPYSATKAMAESLVLSAHSDSFKTVALRPPFIWGPGDAVDGDLGEQVRKGQFEIGRAHV